MGFSTFNVDEEERKSTKTNSQSSYDMTYLKCLIVILCAVYFQY